MSTGDKVKYGLYRIVRDVSIVAFVIQCILCVIQVVFRYIFKVSFPFTEELARYLFIWVTYLGAVLALYRGKDIKMDLLVSYMPVKVQEVCSGFSTMVNTAACLVLFLSGISIARQTMGQTSAALGLPMGLVYGVIVVFALLDFVFDILKRFEGEVRS